jgi:iron complex transport system ATP-binding protein
MTPLLHFGPGAVGIPGHKRLFALSEIAVEPGQFVCLLGPNGSGKSTLLRTLTGLLPPNDGLVRMEGVAIDRLPIAARGRHFAALFASAHLSPVVTVYDLVALGRYPFTGRRGGLSQEDRRIVEEELERLELHPLRHRPLGQLSDGERHRAHLARGLAQRTPLLFLDEGLAFLDAFWRRRIINEIERLCRAGGSVVLATQDIHEALSSADRLWVVDRGASRLFAGGPEDLALAGTVAAAFSQGTYDFDPETNRFEAPRPMRFSFELSGPPEAVAWTRRGLYRAGGRDAGSAPGSPGPLEHKAVPPERAPASEGEKHVVVDIRTGPEGNYLWSVREGDTCRAAEGALGTVTVSSISELVGLLRKPATDR